MMMMINSIWFSFTKQHGILSHTLIHGEFCLSMKIVEMIYVHVTMQGSWVEGREYAMAGVQVHSLILYSAFHISCN